MKTLLKRLTEVMEMLVANSAFIRNLELRSLRRKTNIKHNMKTTEILGDKYIYTLSI